MGTNSTNPLDIDVVQDTDSDIQPTIKQRQTKSEVWNHFTKETVSPGNFKALCMHCNRSFTYRTGTKPSGTSHLKRHFESCIKKPSQIEEKTTSSPLKKRQISSPVTKNVLQTQVSSPETKDAKIKSWPPKNCQKAYPSGPLDQDLCNHEMAKMIIMHDYPLHMVEHPGFVSFLKVLCPEFNVRSFNTVHGDCVTMFLSQKKKLFDFIREIPGGVNLTVDFWSSKQSVDYAFVTGHFVDKDWNLTHFLLNVSVVAFPDSDFALNQPVAACLSDWNLEGKISSIAVSQSVVNKTSIDNLRGFLCGRNQHVLNGQLLMGKCYARYLSSMAQDALTAEQLHEPIKKVRDSIKYVKINKVWGDRIDELNRRFSTPFSYKDLLIDNQTRWDTSYNMLLTACELRQVFSSLETCHPEYKVSISPEEWRKIENLCSCLKVLYVAGNALTVPKFSANDLYHEMTKLQIELSQAAMCEDPDVRNIANSLREKFDEYWRECFLVLAVAVIMDPRFKMHLIEFTFNKLYGGDAKSWIKIINDAAHDLYLSYSEQNPLDTYVDHNFSETEMAHDYYFHQGMAEDANTGNAQSGNETSPQLEQTTESCHQHERQIKVEKQNVVGLWEGVSEESQLTEEDQQHCNDSQAHAMAEEDNTSFPVDTLLEEGSTLITIGESLSDFEIYMSDMKTELDQYLEETLIPRSDDFNVLNWWRFNTTNYPTLSKMAIDLLSVPFTTVSPDSVFDTEVKQMDNYRTTLPHLTLEALLCTKDWLKNGIL